MAMKKILALAALVACGLALPLFAQSDRATITGTVKDPSSAVLPGVRVQVINTGTDAMQTTATDAQGFYRVENLPVGTYTVSFSAAGFKTLERKGITLLISQVAEIDVSLAIGATTQTIEVSSAPPILQTEDTVVSNNLNSEAVSELPLNVQGSRNLSNFIFAYVPGAEGSDYSSHIDGGMALTERGAHRRHFGGFAVGRLHQRVAASHGSYSGV